MVSRLTRVHPPCTRTKSSSTATNADAIPWRRYPVSTLRRHNSAALRSGRLVSPMTSSLLMDADLTPMQPTIFPSISATQKQLQQPPLLPVGRMKDWYTSAISPERNRFATNFFTAFDLYSKWVVSKSSCTERRSCFWKVRMMPTDEDSSGADEVRPRLRTLAAIRWTIC